MASKKNQIAKQPVTAVPNVRKRRSITPLPYPRTVRPDRSNVWTSARAGKTYPLAMIPLMPGDAIVSKGAPSAVMMNIQMEETEKVLANSVQVRARAYFVSLAAMNRWDGLDSVAYSWAGKAGSAALVETDTYAAATHDQFFKPMGEHFQVGENFTTWYVEAYNQVINFERQQVSISLTPRLVTDYTLAQSLWGSSAIASIVPSWDQALELGELDLAALPITHARSSYPVDGVYTQNGVNVTSTTNVRKSDGTAYDPTPDYIGAMYVQNDSSNYQTGFVPPSVDLAELQAELASGGGALTLASIELAKKTQAFARMRQEYAGNEEELIDLLMRGLHIPNGQYTQPILLGSGSTTLQYQQRFATDSANLESYVANGSGQLAFPLRLPPQETGGVVVVVYDIVPERVFDRQADIFARLASADLPNPVNDALTLEPVDVVPNRFVDVHHSVPSGTFGYSYMNYFMARDRVKVGGRYFRDTAALETDEDQQHIWSVRSVDPVLNEDTFLVPDGLSHAVFRDATSDPFIVQAVVSANIFGLTQFGSPIFEAAGDYAAVEAEQDTTLITQP